MIPIYKPYLKNLNNAHIALDSSQISSQGEYLDKAKNLLEDKFKTNIVLLNNGTTATHLVAIGLKYKHPNIKKLIVPNNVYVAAWNSFLVNPKYKLIPIDADLDTQNFDLDKIEVDKDTAILAVHNIGNIIDINELNKFGVPVVEDNCEGLFGKYGEFYSGTKSVVSSVSFFANKTITTGEGGAIMSDDIDLIKYLETVKGQGQTNIKYLHDKLGYNYRMSNIHAAILVDQFEILNDILRLKENVFNRYKNNLSHPRIKFQKSAKNTTHSNWMFGIRIVDLVDISHFMNYLTINGIDSRMFFYPITKHKHLKNIKCNITNANILHKECILLPSYPELELSEVDYICEKIISYINGL